MNLFALFSFNFVSSSDIIQSKNWIPIIDFFVNTTKMIKKRLFIFLLLTLLITILIFIQLYNNMSHIILKTKLNSILGFRDVNKEEEDFEKIKRMNKRREDMIHSELPFECGFNGLCLDENKFCLLKKINKSNIYRPDYG
jgi:hypothetical protein